MAESRPLSNRTCPTDATTSARAGKRAKATPRSAKIALAILCAALFAACGLGITGCSSNAAVRAAADKSETSAASAQAVVSTTSPEAPPATSETEKPAAETTAKQTYSSKYFKVEIPPSWGTDWEVNVGTEYREAMNATNYIYEFTHGGTPQFSISERKFNLGGGEQIGTTDGGAIELVIYDSLSQEDADFVRSHITLA